MASKDNPGIFEVKRIIYQVTNNYITDLSS